MYRGKDGEEVGNKHGGHRRERTQTGHHIRPLKFYLYRRFTVFSQVLDLTVPRLTTSFIAVFHVSFRKAPSLIKISYSGHLGRQCECSHRARKWSAVAVSHSHYKSVMHRVFGLIEIHSVQCAVLTVFKAELLKTMKHVHCFDLQAQQDNL